MPNNAHLTIGSGQVIGLIIGVLVFVAVLGGFVWLSKRMSGGSVFSGKRIKVVDRTMLTRDTTVMLVQIGSRLLAIGVGKSAPVFLCELSASDFPEFSKKHDSEQPPQGFWRRFARNMKANVAGGSVAHKEQDASFSEVLRQIAENDPVPGAENAGDTGYPHLWEERSSPPARPRRVHYQNSIDNMSRLSEPDTLDRRSRLYGDPNIRPYREPAAPPPPEPDPVASEEERAERIDQLLDLIAQRQTKPDERNNTGDMG